MLGKNDMWNDVDTHGWLLCFRTLNYEPAESTQGETFRCKTDDSEMSLT